MPTITAIFCDIGGVLLTNGWERESRWKLAEQFGLDWEEFEGRHDLVSTAFDTGRLTIDQYLDRTVFYRERNFPRQAVRDFMFDQSQPYPDSLELLGRLARSGKYFLAALNNEPTELNLYRIARFGLRNYFPVFFSSCFLAVKKPDQAIYDLALAITQRAPEECLFIDDRPPNVECAERLGMRAIQFLDAARLERDLRGMGLEF
jgi:putative hydrolase of the HAD superfamily